jgi:hypothetical protein
MEESEVARIRRQIELEYEAARRGLEDYAIASRHQFIAARMQRVSQYHQELAQLVGDQKATEIVLEAETKSIK